MATANEGHINLAFQETGDVGTENKSKPNKTTVPVGSERPQWGNGAEFLMSCIAMSVGLGNVWRFPFTAYENGGGAFLIPYFVVVLIIGRPLYYLEMILGQFSSKGNVSAYKNMVPGLRGIGYGQIVSTVSVCTYYCVLMAITLYYLIVSFNATLPWSLCDTDWENCIGSLEKNGTGNTSSSELYYKKTVLHEYSSIDFGIGPPEWKLTLLLLVAWICVAAIAIKGVKSSGKVSYFLALFPYLVLAILLGKAATMEGAKEGIMYFIEPQWEKLLKPQVWYSAVTQCFFSLGIGFGCIVTYSSYNDFQHNIYRDALVVAVMDTFTSLLAGFTVFSILGNLAHELGVKVPEVVRGGGSGLAFISYPETIAKFDWCPQFFAVLFFLMLFVLGMGSIVGLHSAVCAAITDQFPKVKSWMVASSTSLVMFLMGLIYTTPGGQFMLTLVDFFGGTFILYVLTIFEVVTVMWVYGLEDFCLDIQFMLKRKPGIYWRLCWAIITPVFLVAVLIYAMVDMSRLTYGSASYPDEAIVSGWLLLTSGVIQIPLWCLWYMFHIKHLDFDKKMKMAFGNYNWGPDNTETYKKWADFKRRAWDSRRKRNQTFVQYYLSILLGR